MSQDKTNQQNLNAVPEVESLDEKAEEITSGGISAVNAASEAAAEAMADASISATKERQEQKIATMEIMTQMKATKESM